MRAYTTDAPAASVGVITPPTIVPRISTGMPIGSTARRPARAIAPRLRSAATGSSPIRRAMTATSAIWARPRSTPGTTAAISRPPTDVLVTEP